MTNPSELTRIEPRLGNQHEEEFTGWRNTAGDQETLGGLLLLTFVYGLVMGFFLRGL